MSVCLYVDACMSVYRYLYGFLSIFCSVIYIGISFSVYDKGETSAAIMRYGDPTILLPQWGGNICFVIISSC